MATYLDDFNRADGALGSNWILLGGTGSIDIVGNKAQHNSGGWAVYYYAGGTASTADQFVQVKVAGTSGEIQIGLRAEIPSGTPWPNGYAAGVESVSYYAFRYVGGSYIGQIINTVATFAAGNIIRMEAEGDTIRCFLNGSHVSGSPVTDPQPTLVGNRYFYIAMTAGSAIDDFSAGDLGTAPSAFPAHHYNLMMSK